MRALLLFISGLWLYAGVSQQPAYYVLGEDELAGVDVYDLFQDAKGDYWVATNSGLLRYDGHEFHQINADVMLSKSVFNLCEDKNGVVHGNNLSGQIFSVQQDSCKVVHQISEKFMYHNINFAFDNQNVLTVATQHLFQCIEGVERALSDTAELNFFYGMLETPEEELLVFESHSGELIRLKDGKLTQDFKAKNVVLGLHLVDDQLVFYDHKSSSLFRKRNEEFVLIAQLPEGLHRIYSDDEHLWDVQPAGGAYLIDPITSESSSLVYPETIISALLKDKEGNVLVGTFGEGIYVIPNKRAFDYKNKAAIKNPTRLSSMNETLLIGTQDGAVLALSPKNEVRQLFQGGAKMIENLSYFPHQHAILVDDRVAKLIELNSGKQHSIQGVGSIKDVFVSPRGNHLIASNTGVHELKLDPISDRQLLPDLGRSNCVARNEINNIYFIGESSGLKIGQINALQDFELKGESVLCRDILSDKRMTYVCSQGHGVLVFEEDHMINQITVEDGIPSDETLKILAYKNGHVLATAEGLCLIDAEGKCERLLRLAEGLTSPVSADIEIIGDVLYIVHNKGLQSIDLSQLPQDDAEVPLQVMKVFVNDEERRWENGLTLNSDENKLKIVFQLNSLKYRGELEFRYKLSGIDVNWQTNSRSENIVEYKSVPPGEYTFEYQTLLRSQAGTNNKLTFTVAQPFWNRWWFYCLAVLVIAVLAGIVYRWIAKRQRKKELLQKELIASKLTAIQSQMNPHFIFNSLNSIQDLVLKQEGENAYNYISKFAFLVRKVMHSSEVDFIDLEEELQLLQVYLELEQLRFQKDFFFSMNTDIDDEVEIPPMLVQPFIENAIKHGLLHKKGDKKLSINFEMEGELLHCIIEDDGVGRSRSAEINKRKASQHESFSVKSIRSRFDILKSIYGDELGVEFEDLEDPTGTRVTLKIPYQRKY